MIAGWSAAIGAGLGAESKNSWPRADDSATGQAASGRAVRPIFKHNNATARQGKCRRPTKKNILADCFHRLVTARLA